MRVRAFAFAALAAFLTIIVICLLGRHHLDAFGLAMVVPLAVPTRVAWEMLGISNAYGWRLIADGELDSYLEGRIRKVVVSSIQDYVQRKLEAEKRRGKKPADPLRTEKATIASLKRRAERKAAADSPVASKERNRTAPLPTPTQATRT